ncbi:MAG: glycosyl transferase [Candidatus Hydrogenedentota bacterium]
MRIAFLGTRGIPANYGGFETFVEEVAVRLAARGHDVSVYCRSSHYRERMGMYRGVRLVHLPTIHTKHLDSISHTLFSTLHMVWQGADVCCYCGSGNSTFTWMARLAGIKVLLNTDGLEWERAKWNAPAKLYLKIAEWLAAKFAHVLIADSRVIKDYYKRKFNRDTAYVAYGADVVERGYKKELLAQVGVEPEEYFLFVSRLEPENNAHLLVKAFEGVRTDKKLLIVGSAPFADDYIREMKQTLDPRIQFPGGLYGDVYKALQASAYVYVNAMDVGGTHPAILEAMGAGNCVLVSDISYNVEAVAHAGISFRSRDVDDLREKLQWLADHPGEVKRLGQIAVERARKEYDWDRITDDYERIFEQTLAG